MSNENDHPDSKVSNANLILPGNLPAIKPVADYVPPVRQPQLSNRDDVAAIVNNHRMTSSIDPILAGLRRLLIENPTYVNDVSAFVGKLSAEISDTNSAAQG